jgi:hypothetical protein
VSDLNFSNRKDPKFLAATVLLGLVLVAGIVLIGVRLANGNNDNASPPHPTATATDKTPGSTSACGLPDGDQSVPTEAPRTKWSFIGMVAAPRAPKIGPAKITDALSTCFARSPEGALFAAATLLAETYPDDKAAEDAARARMVPNDALEVALATPSKTDRFPSQIVGYKFVDYTANRASLTLASRLSAGPQAGGIGALTMTMVWRKGDWWWELQASTSATAIATLDGFVKWSAVS